MSLKSQIRRRRYKRLGLAMVAALLFHLGLIASGNWGIQLFSAPSNEDRVLTLTLEHTPYEGLKESEKDAQETMNTPNIGQVQAPTEALEKESFEIEDSRLGKPLAASNPVNVPIAQEVEPVEPSAEITEPPTPQPVSSSSETFESIFPQLELMHTSAADFSVNALIQAEEPMALEREVSLEPKQKNMLNKKIEKWANKLEQIDETSEPLIWESKGQNYEAKLRYIPAKDDMATDQLVVEVATEQNGERLTTSMRLKKLAFSNFAQFVHQWDKNTMIHDDEMDGRFHSNTRISLSQDRKGGPVFHGKVTTASYGIDTQGYVNKRRVFLGGLETGVKKIVMPKPRMLFADVQNSAANAVIIQQDSRIIFTEDGHYLWQSMKEVRPMEKRPIGNQPLYLIAAPKVSLNVSGVVNGSVAVYSPKRIVIDGDIFYASIEPLDKGGDFLGLVSGRSVYIAGRDMIAEGDLTIHASIYARSRFGVKGIFGKRSGTINILGSVSAGTLTATEPRYATNIAFDKRLEDVRPPGFPVSDRYELLAAENSWQLEDDPYHEQINLGITESAESSLQLP